ncbi:MAG: BatD family protein [Candidatus Electrothrix sp. YB6]
MKAWGNQCRSVAVRTWLLALLCCAFAAPNAGAAADIQISAELNPTEFTVGETAGLTVTVNGTISAEPERPEVDGLRFYYRGPNQSRQISWVNGKAKVSSSVTFNFLVRADKPGDYTIGPVKVKADGKAYTTQPLKCTVLPAQNANLNATGQPQPQTGKTPQGAARPTRPDVAGQVGFMRIMPEAERIYSGQLVPFILKAYFRSGIRITLKSAPRFSGDDFLLHSLDEKPQQRQERFNGRPYTTLTWQGSLSAVKEGTVPLIVEMDAEALIRQQSRRRTDPFGSSMLNDPFFDSFFGQYSTHEVKITSPEKTITVLDLPAADRPPDFHGAIGNFSLSVAASPLDGKVGDPITLKMQITGSGNFDLVQAPALTGSEGWKTYPAADSFAEQGSGKGKKTFEQAVIPIKQGVTAVPSLRFSYFDPSTEDYVTLTSDPIPLQLQDAVEPMKPAAQPPVSTVQSAQPTQTEDAGNNTAPENSAAKPAPHPAPLKNELGKLVPAIQPLYRKLWFQVMIGSAALCLLAALLLFLHRKKLENDPAILLRKQVKQQLAQHYQAMQQAIAAQDQERFQQHCRTAVQQRTGEVWGLAPEAITLADLEQRLPEDAPLRNIFSRLEQSGYAGEHLAQAELEETLQTTRNELEKLV